VQKSKRGVPLEFRVLQYFLAVAREESITRAAETLKMTQPPLSRQLKDLEDELGKKLLIRGSKKVTLTEDGMLLRKRAEEMIDLMEKTKAELTGSDQSINGDIYIGGGETDAVSLLAQVAGDLRKNHPAIHYRIYSGDATIVTEKLDKGLIDFGLFVGPVDVGKYDYLRLPIHDTWGVLMRKDSPLAARERICAKYLRDKPLIVSHQIARSSDLKAWLKTEVEKLNIVMSYDLIYNASHFVKKGLGYALALDKIINTTGDSELCFRPLYPSLEAPLYFVWKKYQVFSKAPKAFLRQLRSELETRQSGPDGSFA